MPRSEIESIVYDKRNQILTIKEKKEEKGKNSQYPETIPEEFVIPINGWKFIPGKGFYADEPHELLKTPVLQGEEIVHALTEYTHLISSLIVDCHVYQEPILLSYQLRFDENWNLHIVAYLLEPGDLKLVILG